MKKKRKVSIAKQFIKKRTFINGKTGKKMDTSTQNPGEPMKKLNIRRK